MDITTNIIKNVYNIGTSSCDAGTQYCTDGYGLYFPCLKSITKGQDVCFDFYIADYAGKNAYDLANSLNTDSNNDTNDTGKELADLRDVDAISLNLVGPFNCTFGTFSYPDNISSLQTEEYPVKYVISPEDKRLYNLNLYMLDIENESSEVYINSQDGVFYSGTEVEIAAYDTPTHIFIGWATFDIDDEDCPDETIYDNIISKKNVYNFVINEDTVILALYRPRKVYNVVSDPTNVSSHFNVNYGNVEYHISNRPDEEFDDGYNSLEKVLEGYHIVVSCIPSTDVLGDNDDMRYEFLRWKDNSKERTRLLIVGKDTKSFESGSTIKLKAICTGPVPYYELEDEDIVYLDEFDEEGIHINTLFSDVEIVDYYGDEHVSYTNEVYQKYIDGDGFLYFNNGTLVLSSSDIEDGIKINIHAKSEEGCELSVSVNGSTLNQIISQDEFMLYDFYFSKCNKSYIEIKVDGECLVDRIEVCMETFVNKGKAQLCLDSEITSNLPSGKLSVNGAVMIDGKSYGLTTVQIGEINKLPKITLNING